MPYDGNHPFLFNQQGGLQGLAGFQQQAQGQGLRDTQQGFLQAAPQYYERDYFTEPPPIKTTFKEELQCGVDLWLSDVDI